ncbi:similar to Phytoene dehydrogenase (Phytoene desaturase) [Plenodomus lingam JN3]|uniref:Phytoene desaturase n=1 Tax=Leptosphaeria maculans (strain JN3 / isolate v23.1.3 / race Av1-4-5-6-7-8) TaxID=985895 RepID=E4ZUB8_LEPMJ|nr:similar to Phytoene dehydrogenase (Phytoene desaturase) [Plenodomus lingam JN3]CBX94997.1 similar to Phytoene dehydrogenase (Phytoene desaturase) [Plenodomus lingam JN3]
MGVLRFDQGPSLLLLPHLFHETFHDLGTSLATEGVELVKCEPNYNIHFHDATSIKLSTDIALMKEEIERFEGKDGFERYLGFLQESHRHYELSVKHVLKKNFYSLLSMLRMDFLWNVLALHPFESIYTRASKYFYTERLRRVFTFASMYMGMSPFDAPGTYSLLQYTELAEGIWYPIGGFHKVVEALVNIGQRLGVDYKFNTPISQIQLSDDQKRATGVILQDGTVLTADTVICNADLPYAYNHLLPASSFARALLKRKASCSSISFYWALDQQFPQLTAHSIFLAEDYKESFDSIFKKHLIPDQPSFYVNVPSRVDPSAAPPNRDSIVVLVPVGHLQDSTTNSHNGSQAGTPTQDWPTMVAKARTIILQTIESRLNIALGPHILHEEINTPPSWKDAFNLDRGAILGLSHSFFNVLSFRPRTKHASIQGLYFVGASTHPGTGVPIVLAGAKLVAEQVLAGLGRGDRVPWGRGEGKGEGKKSALDRVGAGWGWEWVVVVLVAVLAAVFARGGR